MALTPRDAYLRRTYGITEDEYRAMLAAQDWRCAICHREPAAGKNLHVDHDHRTGVVRGLLCMTCNHDLLGRRDGDPELFRRAAEYLEDPPAPRALGREQAAPTRPKRRKRVRKGNDSRTGSVTRRPRKR